MIVQEQERVNACECETKETAVALMQALLPLLRVFEPALVHAEKEHEQTQQQQREKANER